MNFFGKILTGLICIVALFLMWVSIMVYATHKNWKADADSFKTQWDQATATNDQLRSDHRIFESQSKAEIEVKLQEVRTLESERDTLTTEKSTIQSELRLQNWISQDVIVTNGRSYQFQPTVAITFLLEILFPG